jgi:tRNA threonylcarbamoyl adenosine modification protein YjeE
MGIATFNSRNEAEIEAVARDFAAVARSGDLITLRGDLGAGKTSFSRAFIRRYLDKPDLEVPSPTYLIAVEYQADTGTLITHMDLYRISGGDEMDELGLEEALERGVVLIEWPEQASNRLPADRFELSFEITGELTRNLGLAGNAEMQQRFLRSVQIGNFLRRHWCAQFSRKPFAADASARNYELVENGSDRRILMDAPSAPDGPPVRGGQAYSKIAHLAEEVRSFVALAKLLRARGFYTPQIYCHEYDKGLVLLEHLGCKSIVDDQNHPLPDRYIEAAKLLAEVHMMDWPNSNIYGENETYLIPSFDPSAMLIEVELLTDWYLTDSEFHPDESDRRDFIQIWSQYCQTARNFRSSLVLRDYHSPNIIWREQCQGFDRIGLIDFQDAMIGPAVYDLVSLAQDARAAVAPELESQIIRRYLDLLATKNVEIDERQFQYEYALMGAQRASKLLGIFVRLDVRDGKTGYRKLIPGIRDNLKRNLQHPQLSRYRQWCERVIKL